MLTGWLWFFVVAGIVGLLVAIAHYQENVYKPNKTRVILECVGIIMVTPAILGAFALVVQLLGLLGIWSMRLSP